MATGRISSLFRLVRRYGDGAARRMGARGLSEHAPIIQKNNESGTSHVNCAALESGVTTYYCNRNPRSLELMGMAEKPRGFATKKQRVDYYHRLMLDISLRHVTASVNHNSGEKVVEASTKEFCIARHLHKTSDVSAAFNVGRVIALRCKESGLNRVMWEHKKDRKHRKVMAFMRGVKLGGLILNEPKARNILPKPGTLPGY